MSRIKERLHNKNSKEIARICTRAGLDKKAEDLVVLDVHQISSFADYFVIMSGRSTRHVQGLAETIDKELGSKRLSSKNTEGYSEGLWILLDYDDVVVHVFYRENRIFYDLEGLWHDAPRVDLTGKGKARKKKSSP